jgi:hypothetical protein
MSTEIEKTAEKPVEKSPETLTDWGNIDSKRRGGKTNFLRLKSREKPYTVRLFHKPKEVYRYYLNNKSAITADPDNCPVAIKHGEKPKLRYAINVIDRDDGEVKVLEAPAMVFKEFKKFYEANQIDPGGNDAPDFVIKVEGSGIDTKYSVAYKMKAQPFSAEEKALLREKKYDLAKLFAPTENIEQHLYGEGGNAAAEKPAEAPAAGGVKKSAGDEDMGWANE